MTGNAALVWFKRDLRVRDHAALAEAAHFDSALGLVVIEPQWLGSPKAVAAAKEKLYGQRRTREAHAEADAIQHKHGSRKSGLPPTAAKKRRARAAPDGQGQLF